MGCPEGFQEIERLDALQQLEDSLEEEKDGVERARELADRMRSLSDLSTCHVDPCGQPFADPTGGLGNSLFSYSHASSPLHVLPPEI